MSASGRKGWLALVGGGEWRPGCDFDRELLEASGAKEVVVLPTAAAFEHPDRAVETARAWFATLGASVRSCPILGRHDADDEALVAIIRSASFLYIGGGSPMHLRGVLKETAAWDAICTAWGSGAVLAASSAGAMVLGDPMVDPRGGVFTLGLAIVDGLAILPHADSWPEERLHRTMKMAGDRITVALIDERTALLRDPDGAWSTAGAGRVVLHAGGTDSTSLTALAGR